MNENPRLPVLRNPPLPARQNARHPATWQAAAPVVARGAALVAAGLVGEWLLRSLARNALGGPRNGRSKPRKVAALVPRPAEERDPSQGTITISETVIMTRRVILRR
jgi:hypothetical protein